jgi:hypothetical protein
MIVSHIGYMTLLLCASHIYILHMYLYVVAQYAVLLTFIATLVLESDAAKGMSDLAMGKDLLSCMWLIRLLPFILEYIP